MMMRFYVIAALLALFVAGPLHAQQAEPVAVHNMRQVALGIIDYARDHQNKFPPMKTPGAMKKAVRPYVKSDSVFLDPVSRAAFVPNPHFSQMPIGDIQDKDLKLVLFYDPTSVQGHYDVCFGDGHLKEFTASQWKTLKRASKIP